VGDEVFFPPALERISGNAACMPVRRCALNRITLRDGCALRVQAIGRVEPDRAAVSQLLRACPATDRVRRAGSVDVDVAAEWLLPRGPLDVALGAVGPSGALAAVANANVVADGSEAFEIAILVAPAWRGRGLAATLLQATGQLLPRVATASGVIGREDARALSLLGGMAPTATMTVNPDSVTFRVAVGHALVGSPMQWHQQVGPNRVGQRSEPSGVATPHSR
jgi:GNAT superfamily N-acetyltransferase